MAMERERVREKEPEKFRYLSKEDPYCFLSREEERKHLASLPRIIHTDEAVPMVIPVGVYDEMQREMARRGGGLHIYLDWHYNKWNELKHPIYGMTCMAVGYREGGRPKLAGRWGGGHRHYMEAVFYFPPGGKGHEEQDGIRYEWEGEGVLGVPTYVLHNHYSDVPWKEEETGYMFAVISRVFEYLGIADLEQFTINPEWEKAFKGVPNWLGRPNSKLESFMHGMRKVTKWDGGEPKGVYDRFLKTLADDNQWHRTAPRFVAAESATWENSPQGRIKYLIHPWNNFDVKSLNVYIQEIPPGSRSGKHRHVYEEILFVQKGQGYDVHDGVRYDWKTKDLICIPLMTEHQHFNTGKETAKVVGVFPRWYYYLGIGGIEQLEDCPEYKKGR